MSAADLELDARRRRARLRAWRRGTREMDLLLGPFADARLPAMGPEEIAAFEALAACDDHALYRWIAGQEAPEAAHATLVAEIRADAAARHGPPGGGGAEGREAGGRP